MVGRYGPIAALALLHLALALLYSWAVPLGEGPDEPGHAAYAFYLARTGSLPVQWASAANAGRPIVGAPVNPDTGLVADAVAGEGHQPPLAYLLAAPAALLLPTQARSLDLPGNPRFVWARGDQPNAAFHGTRERWPWTREVWIWRLMRLVSAACGALTVALTWGIARRCGLRQPLLAAALVALNPQLIFGSALVSNDPLLTALAALLLWLALGGGGLWGWRRAAALGLTLGLTLLTKQSAVLLLPVALVGAWRPGERGELPQSRRGRRGRTEEGADNRRDAEGAEEVKIRPAAPERAQRAMPPSGASAPERSECPRAERVPPSEPMRAVLLCLAVAALVCGWWYLRNWQLYGDPLAAAVFRAEFATQPFAWRSAAAWGAALAQLYASCWARFGWLTVRPPAWVDWFYAGLGLLAVVGSITAVVGRRGLVGGSAVPRFRGSAVPWFRGSVLWLTVVLAFGWVVAFALSTGLVAWQGRLLFPALPALAVLLAGGLARLAGRSSRTAALMLGLALAALALWLPFGLIRPAYPFVALTNAGAQQAQQTLIASYGRFGRPSDPGAELLGWRANADRGAGTVTVTLLWHALGRQNRDWTVFVHLVDAQGQIVAEANAQPTGGAYPMSAWVAGDWVSDTQLIALPKSLAPGSYTLRAGLWDPNWGGRRAGLYNQRGKLAGDSLDLGIIKIAS